MTSQLVVDMLDPCLCYMSEHGLAFARMLPAWTTHMVCIVQVVFWGTLSR